MCEVQSEIRYNKIQPWICGTSGTIVIVLDNKPALVREISREDARRVIKLLGEQRGIGQ